MTDSNQQQPLHYMLLTCDRHTLSVAGLNMFVNTQPLPCNFGSVSVQH